MPDPQFDRLSFMLAQLDRQMGFFPRVDAKAGWVGAVDLGILSVVALNFPYHSASSPMGIAGVLSGLLAALSLAKVALVFFPRRRGASTASLLYFQDVAQLGEEEYRLQAASVPADRLFADAAAQVHRNAQILKDKYDHAEAAMLFAGSAALPWLGFIIAAAIDGGLHLQ